MIAPLSTLGGILPGCFAHLQAGNHHAVLVCSLADSSRLSLLSLSDGSLLDQWSYPDIIICALAHDESTNKTWVAGFAEKEDAHRVYELGADGKLISAVTIDAVVDISVSTYCSKGHVFFLTLRDDDVASGVALVRVDTQRKQLLGKKVPLDEEALILMWDSSTATMFAWIATDHVAGALVILDIMTGKTLRTIAQFPKLSPNTGSGAASVFDAKARVVHASLIDLSTNPARPFFVAVNTTSGAHTGSARADFALDLSIASGA